MNKNQKFSLYVLRLLKENGNFQFKKKQVEVFSDPWMSSIGFAKKALVDFKYIKQLWNASKVWIRAYVQNPFARNAISLLIYETSTNLMEQIKANFVKFRVKKKSFNEVMRYRISCEKFRQSSVNISHINLDILSVTLSMNVWDLWMCSCQSQFNKMIYYRVIIIQQMYVCVYTDRGISCIFIIDHTGANAHFVIIHC